MNFLDAAADLRSLRDNFAKERRNAVEGAITEGQRFRDEYGVAFEKRQRRKKMMPGEKCRDAGLTAEDEMKRVMFGTIARLTLGIKERFTRLVDLDSKFGFLLDTHQLLYGETDDLADKCASFAQYYRSGVNGSELDREVDDCSMLLSVWKMKLMKAEDLLKFIIYCDDESVFPNLRVAIQILLTIAVSIASCERSFSKLKLILSHLRASMTQERMVDLTLLSIEKEETETTDFESVTEDFASVKARKKQF